MDIGVPLEIGPQEHRVGLTPFGAARLTRAGHQVFVQHDAGRESHFEDEDYHQAGARIVFDEDEVWQRSDLILRVGKLTPAEVDQVASGSTICGFLHLAVMNRELVSRLAEKNVSLLGWEMVEDAEGHRPVLTSLSEIGGHMAVHTAAHFLQHEAGGRGLILGGVPGIPPATVVILGAGTLGRTAAQLLCALGAHVIVLDAELTRLREISSLGPTQVATAIATPRNLAKYSSIADVLIGAVFIPGARAPYLVTEEMVKGMKKGSVILDLSIDQGGCVETSRPTTTENPVFVQHGVLHYGVPTMTTSVPRTASRALTLAALPYLLRLADDGLPATLRHDPAFARSVYLYRGKVVNEATALSLGLPFAPLSSLLD